MEKVYIVLQESNVDGEHLINATPCADFHSAKAVMDEEVRTLLSSGKYEGLDLDEIERDQNDEDADCDYYLERDETSFYLAITCDDYYEYITIEEKEIVKMG
jgi:hypothetical protein